MSDKIYEEYCDDMGIPESIREIIKEGEVKTFLYQKWILAKNIHDLKECIFNSFIKVVGK